MVDKQLVYKKFESFRFTQLIQQEIDTYKELIGEIKVNFEEYQNMVVRECNIEKAMNDDFYLLNELLDALYEYRKQHNIKPYRYCTLNLHNGKYKLTWQEESL